MLQSTLNLARNSLNSQVLKSGQTGVFDDMDYENGNFITLSQIQKSLNMNKFMKTIKVSTYIMQARTLHKQIKLEGKIQKKLYL